MLIPDILGYGLICYFILIPIAAVITAYRRSEELKEIKDKIESLKPNVNGSFIHDSIDNLLYAIRCDKENYFACRVTSILEEKTNEYVYLLKMIQPYKTKIKRTLKSPTKQKV